MNKCKWLLGSVSALAIASAAQAADLQMYQKAPPPVAAVAPWAGFYIGVDGGVVRHEASFNDLSAFSFSSGTHSLSDTGGLAGGFVGYNWQHRSFVFGVEADASWVGARAETTWGGSSIFTNSFTQSQDVNWVATFRARAGLDFESTLFYLTGGLAVGGVKNSFSAFCPSGFTCGGVPRGAMFASFSEDTTRVGWTVGAGFEHMFDSRWTVRGEFRYVDLGRSSVSCQDVVPGTVCSAPGNSYRGEFSNTLMTGLVGLAYKF
jgi:outer membrane immunogenic protein